MIATYVEDKLTPISLDDLVRVVSEVLPVYMPGASAKAKALVSAKMALETARGEKVHRFNLGNQKAVATSSGRYTCFACDEIINDVRIVFRPETPYDPRDPTGMPNPKFPSTPVPPGNPQSRFRAFANIYDGAYQYFDLLESRKRYAEAWAALATGDARAFVFALKRGNYFTASVDKYHTAVASLQREMERRIAGMPALTTPRDPELEALFERVIAAQFSLEDLLRETPTEPPPDLSA